MKQIIKSQALVPYKDGTDKTQQKPNTHTHTYN